MRVQLPEVRAVDQQHLPEAADVGAGRTDEGRRTAPDGVGPAASNHPIPRGLPDPTDLLAASPGWTPHRTKRVDGTDLFGLQHHRGKTISRDCIKCKSFYARMTEQLIGQLPVCRATPAPAFSSTGMDFAGSPATSAYFSAW